MVHNPPPDFAIISAHEPKRCKTKPGSQRTRAYAGRLHALVSPLRTRIWHTVPLCSSISRGSISSSMPSSICLTRLRESRLILSTRSPLSSVNICVMLTTLCPGKFTSLCSNNINLNTRSAANLRPQRGRTQPVVGRRTANNTFNPGSIPSHLRKNTSAMWIQYQPDKTL